MAELTSTKLNPESHLLLDQSLLRLPHELLRKNFKSSQRAVEREREHVLNTIKATAKASLAAAAVEPNSQATAALDTMISRMEGLKRKLQSLHEEENTINEHTRKRIQHLQDLYDIPSLIDVKYDEWSKIRLNRLLVDYLLRNGYGKSARALAAEKGIEELVDTEVFLQCDKIRTSLEKRRTQDCLAWCSENKQALKKSNNNLEFQIRLQQYIEMIRTGEPRKLLEARQHAQKYLAPHKDSQFPEIKRAAGLLAFPADTQAEPYKTWYAPERWNYLSDLFVSTHHALYSLPARPLLHIALSAGLSALKTPSCHSELESPSNANSAVTAVCPICSTELNDLARSLPYAHHTKSHVEGDPVVLPNGRIYGRDKLIQTSAKVGATAGHVKDPVTGEIFEEGEVEKVYIS